MKKKIFAVASASALLLVTVSSYAGSPTQDPEIAKMRTAFSSAETPSLQKLVATGWVCTERSALTDNFTPSTTFENGYFFKISFVNEEQVVENMGTTNIKIFKINNTSLNGLFGSLERAGYPLGEEVIRMTSDGKLAIEYSILADHVGVSPADTNPIAQLPSGFHVGEYTICIPELN